MKSKFKLIIYSSIQFVFFFMFFKNYQDLSEDALIEDRSVNESRNSLEKIFSRRMLFVGGLQNSGQEIIKSFLEETKRIKISYYDSKIAIDFKEHVNEVYRKKLKFIKNAQFKDENINKAIGLFTFYILSTNVTHNDYVCSIDERNVLLMEFYKNIFPKAKFIYLVRDGRQFAYSQIETNKTFENFFKKIQHWGKFNENAFNMCKKIGSSSCLLIKYDQLIANSSYLIEKIAKFLEIDYFAKKKKALIYETDLDDSFEQIQKYDANIIRKKIKMLSKLKFV